MNETELLLREQLPVLLRRLGVKYRPALRVKSTRSGSHSAYRVMFGSDKCLTIFTQPTGYCVHVDCLSNYQRLAEYDVLLADPDMITTLKDILVGLNIQLRVRPSRTPDEVRRQKDLRRRWGRSQGLGP